MNITELKELAESIISTITQLEDAQGEIRDLRATEAWLVERVKELEGGMTQLMRNFPTDFDMNAAGWDGQEIESACAAHDAARALLEKKE